MRRSRVILAFLSGILLVSCGAGTSSSSGPAPTVVPAPTQPPAPSQTSNVATGSGVSSVDPCNLLDQLAATSFFQNQANPGVKNTSSNSASCMYTSAVQGDQLTINVVYLSGTAKDSTDYTSVKTGDTTPVPNVGDDAYYNKALFSLTVAKDHLMFTINGAQRGTKVGADNLVQLANLVLLRIQQLSNS